MDRDLKKEVLALFREAKSGKVVIESETSPWFFYVKFFARVENEALQGIDDDTPIIEIPNLSRFLDSAEEYVNVAGKFYSEDKGYMDIVYSNQFAKKLLMDAFVNCSVEDMYDINKYIQQKTAMLINSEKLLHDLKIENKPMFSKRNADENSKPSQDAFLGEMEIANTKVKLYADLYKNHASIEAPLVFLPYMQNEQGEVFYLPGVLFGTSVDAKNKNSAFVGAVQNFSAVQNDRFSKNMDRFIRKVNSGVVPDSIEGNVSPKAVVSFVLFMGFLNSRGVQGIKANNYLPIRYASKIGATNKISLSPEARAEKQERIDADQYNITNKFMFLFARMKHHFENLQLDYNESGCKMDLNMESVREDNVIYDFVRSEKKVLDENEKI
ncbi:MAG: hypothetical protein IJS68_01250 [Clostridia bacterium]|nr:hypothetical protein [Clostridia bacterium]